jgi:hypothetical protein
MKPSVPLGSVWIIMNLVQFVSESMIAGISSTLS